MFMVVLMIRLAEGVCFANYFIFQSSTNLSILRIIYLFSYVFK